jgi:hypothetical protein
LGDLGHNPRSHDAGSAAGGCLDYQAITHLTGLRLGVIDIGCPECGPRRHAVVNQRRKVLRVWHVSPGFLTYRCARCDIHGYARDDGARSPDRAELAKARAESQRMAAETSAAKQAKARWLWNRRHPIAGTTAERYLREVRRYGGPIPATIGFLPGRQELPPAMISAFGLPHETGPGEIAVSPAAVQAVHITKLAPDGSDKAGTAADKIMIGTPRGAPIAVAPLNDLLGLAITEGIEDALSVHEGTGLGAWAAGAAPFMPPLANVIPAHLVEFVTIIADMDKDGQRFASELQGALKRRGIAHTLFVWGAA